MAIERGQIEPTRRIDFPLRMGKKERIFLVNYSQDVPEESVKEALGRWVKDVNIQRAFGELQKGQQSRVLTHKGLIIGIQIPEDLPKAV